jgi:hypothetical protein
MHVPADGRSILPATRKKPHVVPSPLAIRAEQDRIKHRNHDQSEDRWRQSPEPCSRARFSRRLIASDLPIVSARRGPGGWISARRRRKADFAPRRAQRTGPSAGPGRCRRPARLRPARIPWRMRRADMQRRTRCHRRRPGVGRGTTHGGPYALAGGGAALSFCEPIGSDRAAGERTMGAPCDSLVCDGVVRAAVPIAQAEAGPAAMAIAGAGRR